MNSVWSILCERSWKPPASKLNAKKKKKSQQHAKKNCRRKKQHKNVTLLIKLSLHYSDLTRVTYRTYCVSLARRVGRRPKTWPPFVKVTRYLEQITAAWWAIKTTVRSPKRPNHTHYIKLKMDWRSSAVWNARKKTPIFNVLSSSRLFFCVCVFKSTNREFFYFVYSICWKNRRQTQWKKRHCTHMRESSSE